MNAPISPHLLRPASAPSQYDIDLAAKVARMCKYASGEAKAEEDDWLDAEELADLLSSESATILQPMTRALLSGEPEIMMYAYIREVLELRKLLIGWITDHAKEEMEREQQEIADDIAERDEEFRRTHGRAPR